MSAEDQRQYQRHCWRSERFHRAAKTWHGLARVVRRELGIQAFLTATAVNLKGLAAALLRGGDGELHAPEAAPDELPEERGPGARVARLSPLDVCYLAYGSVLIGPATRLKGTAMKPQPTAKLAVHRGTLIQEIGIALSEPAQIRRGGRLLTVTRAKAVAESIIGQTLAGNQKAAKLLYTALLQLDEPAEQSSVDPLQSQTELFFEWCRDDPRMQAFRDMLLEFNPSEYLASKARVSGSSGGDNG
jgi:hypothetical protein